MAKENKNKNPIVKRLLQAVVVILIFVGLIVAVLSLGDLNTIGDIFKNININYLLIALGLTIIYFIFMVLPHFIIAVSHKTKMDKTRLFLNASNEFFFNAITPAQSGSQPFHSVIYLQHGVTADETSSILTTTYINYQVVANFLSTIALVILALFHSSVLQGRLIIVILGFLLNFAVLVLIFFLTFSKKFPTRIQRFLYWLAKFKPFRERLTKVADDTPQIVRKFQKSTRETMKKKRFLILTTIVRIIALLAYYSIPFIVALALNIPLTAEHFLYMMAISLVSTTLMAWFPLPGSSGGVETVFVILLTALPVINQTEGLTIMLVTRLLTFYLGMIWGAVALGILKLMDLGKNRKIKKYQDEVKDLEKDELRIGILCDSFVDDLVVQNTYNNLLASGQNPIIITHDINKDNPDNTVYIKASKLRILKKFKSNNYFLLRHNYNIIKKHNLHAIHFVNAIRHSRLVQYIKKITNIPIFVTDSITCQEFSSFNALQKANMITRLERMIITADRVLPVSVENNKFYHQNRFKPSFSIDPTLFSLDDFNKLEATYKSSAENNESNLLSDQFKYRYLLAFADNEVERFIDFYFGIKENEEIFNDYQFIIVGNLALPQSILRSISKNHFDNNFVFIDDYDNAISYLPQVDGYIKEEYSAITSIFYIGALKNNKQVLLPEVVLIPEDFNSLESIHRYNYANNFKEQLEYASTLKFSDNKLLLEYFSKPQGAKLASLYLKTAKEKWKEFNRYEWN